jgi:PPP family 3-phenylpropionic acid transporter
MRAFCIASFLLQMAAASYYSFYPIYLSAKVGLPRHWAGMIMNVGNVFEIVTMLAFGRMFKHFGPRRFLLMAAGLMAIRMALLAMFPNSAVAIGTQAFHGIMVLLLQVAPIVLIDRFAESRFRNSMQGLYVMVVIGGGRITGNMLVGPIAQHGYQLAYAWSAGLVLMAVVLLLVAYHPEKAAEIVVAEASPPTEAPEAE